MLRLTHWTTLTAKIPILSGGSKMARLVLSYCYTQHMLLGQLR